MEHYSYIEQNPIINDGKCPFCGQKIELTESEKLIDYGAIVKKCDKCGQILYDKRVKELAIVGIQKDDKRLIRSFAVTLLLIGILLTVVSISFFITLDGRMYIRTKSVIGSVIGIILGPVLAIYGLYTVIKDIATFSERKKLLQSEMELSRKRISDPEYMGLISKLPENKREGKLYE